MYVCLLSIPPAQKSIIFVGSNLLFWLSVDCSFALTLRRLTVHSNCRQPAITYNSCTIISHSVYPLSISCVIFALRYATTRCTLLPHQPAHLSTRQRANATSNVRLASQTPSINIRWVRFRKDAASQIPSPLTSFRHW